MASSGSEICRELQTCVWPVYHMQQRYSWDCGVTTVIMILGKQDRDFLYANIKKVAEEEGFNKSTWTIDLAYLLHRFNIKHLYCTKTLGVDPGYGEEGFYKSVLTLDEERVKKKFENALQNGVHVLQKSVSCDEIISHLNKGLPAIALVNSSLLVCNVCLHNKLIFRILQLFPMLARYVGHYILVVGYNATKDCFLYRNPSLSKDICEISSENFERARKSYGTDEDIIFISS